MNFTEIPNGESLFLDANTLVYHFCAHATLGSACRALVERIARREIGGFTSSHVLSNMAHRLMTIEACETFHWPYAGIAERLNRHHAEISQLTSFRQAVEAVPNVGIQVVPVGAQEVIEAADISRDIGLLSGDALVVAVMRHHALTSLASHDSDFDRVPGLTRYAPA